MTIPRLFLSTPLAAGQMVEADPGQGHYLNQVLRRKPGDLVHLFNGADGEWEARIESGRKDKAVLELLRPLRAQATGPDMRLIIAAVKRDAMDWIVEKATELGVSRIQPVTTARTITDRVNTARLANIAREAAEQCERLDVPAVAEPLPLFTLLDRWDGAPIYYGAAREDAQPLARALSGARPPLAWLVGPEGGFTGPELDVLLRHPFLRPAGLGPRILRAETAAVSGLVLLQSLCGDWQETTV
ncbi:16S rRNA (uracil(1498)-N(3))-methyltransferase [Acetobacteraceae bacterium H6797]|nr:16S rRNA (uracil(1498)-N(3))-methyltransferase [Acetobacteraceae bacterium H6797]